MFRQTTELPADVVSSRRAIFIATSIGLTVAGSWLLFGIFQPGGIYWTEWVLLGLFIILFGQLSFGFSIALWGFFVRVLGGDRWEIMRTLDGRSDTEPPGSTAVVMPIFNENTDRVFQAIDRMYESVGATGAGQAFDFYILSDSNSPSNWVNEELAWVDLCTRRNAWGRIFYRKRRISINGKSGNVADFCRRWGRRYRYMIVLDADSVMEGETLVRLARVMDANPSVGLVQTAPQIVRGVSFYQRLVQFAVRSVGPIFAAGSNFWHLGGSNYWGHNAIIRLQPFMEHCVLPELPGRSKQERHILSHDTVEAALMQQAGYQVWFAYLEPGSYEEGPPNLSDSLRRDRRWCQGNLQHFWFLFAPETTFTNRVHILFGLMAYLSAPLLVCFIALSAFDFFWKEKFAAFAALTESFLWAPVAFPSLALLGLTLLLLFLPKVLGTIQLLPARRQHGGLVRVCISSFLETGMSVLMAPIYLYFYTKFVLLTAFGLRIHWKAQNRSGAEIPLGVAIREYGETTIAGLLVAVATAIWVPPLLPWLAPVWVGLILSVPLVVLTSSERVGTALRKAGLLLIPEEIHPPRILQGLDEPLAAHSQHQIGGGLAQVLVEPGSNAIHSAMLKRSRVRSRHKADYMDQLASRLLAGGPDALEGRELLALLWDGDAIERLHRNLWQSPNEALHPYWRSLVS